MRCVLVLLTLFSVVLMTGCGSDGDPGNAYLAIDWVYTPLSYWDNNPGIPMTFYRATYYPSEPGSYAFNYQAWDGSYWYGTYTVTVEPGDEGGLFPWNKGDDGRDKYFVVFR